MKNIIFVLMAAGALTMSACSGMGEKNEKDESRSYGEIYPSVSLGTQIGKVQMQLGYSVKTTRPSYHQLGNYTIYANRYSMQTGNPLLKNSTRQRKECYSVLDRQESYRCKGISCNP